MCSKAIGLLAIQRWVYQPRNKTLKIFWNVFFTFISKQMSGINIKKVAKCEDIQIGVFSKCSRWL